VGLAFDLEDYHPSVLLHCWLGHLTCKIVSEMTYNVSSGMLNPTIPLHLRHALLLHIQLISWYCCEMDAVPLMMDDKCVVCLLGLLMHATILAYMFSLVEMNKVTCGLGPNVQPAQNMTYIQEFLANLLKTAFPHLNKWVAEYRS